MSIGTIGTIAAFILTTLSIIGIFWKQGYDRGELQAKINHLAQTFDEEKKETDTKLDDLYRSRLETASSITGLQQSIAGIKEQLADIKADVTKSSDKIDMLIRELLKKGA